MKKSRMKYCTLPVVIVLSSILLIIGCKVKSSSPVIARVGNSTLTLEDLYRNIPPEYSDRITREQNINYVKQWMDTELLYREALRKKFDHEKQIKERLGKMKKDMLAAEIISRFSSQNKAPQFDDNTIRQYYNVHKNEFVRERDEVKYLEIVVDKEQTAWYVSKNARSDNFLDFAEQYSKQPIQDTSNLPFVPVEELLPEIRQAISSTPVQENTLPVKSELGWHVIRIIDKLNKGTVCKEDEAWEEIVNQLTAKVQKEEMEKHLSELRLKTDVQFNFDLIPGSNNQKVDNEN